jgi:hypothetical protein
MKLDNDRLDNACFLPCSGDCRRNRTPSLRLSCNMVDVDGNFNLANIGYPNWLRMVRNLANLEGFDTLETHIDVNAWIEERARDAHR